MADQDFTGAAVAVAVQTGFGVENTTLAAVGNGDLSNGYVLGDAESGDAESGIVIPNLEGVYRDVARVAGTLTEQADALEKVLANGFQFSWVHQGNGATSTPSVGEANLSTIIPGLEAILESAGLEGTTGGAGGEQDYNTRTGANIYTTWKIFHGDLSMVFSDCLVETLTFKAAAGGFVIATADIKVGTFDTSGGFSDGVTFPTIAYEEMASLTGPKVLGAAFTAFGQTRGFTGDFEIKLASEIEEFGDSNVAVTGTRLAQNRRVISVNGVLYVNASDSAAAFDNLIRTSAPTVDLSFQVGTPSDDPYNAFKFYVNNLQSKSIKYNRIGTTLVVELNDAKATGTAGADEFQLEQN